MGLAEGQKNLFFLSWGSLREFGHLLSVNLQWSASPFGSAIHTPKLLAGVCMAASIHLILLKLPDEKIIGVSHGIRGNNSLALELLRKIHTWSFYVL